ncbi:Uncharacterised protein [Mycobacteroides abscessus subsp. abscessus]|nr:Uncharacterised protein [Mycobacteroides abscessus subsp. abscessus]SKU79400.1 Uncharacterised protein [Mycobacteroides abscessus subsp. abscessus]
MAPSPRASAALTAERMVNSMLVPVSASATGKTFSRLISSLREIRPSTEARAQSSSAALSSTESRMWESLSTGADSV